MRLVTMKHAALPYHATWCSCMCEVQGKGAGGGDSVYHYTGHLLCRQVKEIFNTVPGHKATS